MSTPQNTENSIHKQRKFQKHIVKKEIRCILQQICISYLLSDTIVNLFELSPDEVKEKLYELKLPAKKGSVADLLIHRAQVFSVKELEEIVYSLRLYQCVFASKKKTWITVTLLEPKDDFHCSREVDQIRVNILQAVRIAGLNAVVKVVDFKGMIWVMIIEKKLTRGKGIKLQIPIVFCYELDTNFIFINRSVGKKIMDCILRAFQYSRSKLHNLQGKDVKSLLALVKNKGEHQNMEESVTLLTGEPEVGHRSVNYSNRKARKSYATKLFQTKEPIQLETLTVNVAGVWRDTTLVPSMVGEPMRASLQLKSKNMVGMMKQMVADNMVATPVPEYILSVLRCGKNKIDMRVPRSK